MVSGHSPRWRRLLHRVPLLFNRCPEGNYHWLFDQLCKCDHPNLYSFRLGRVLHAIPAVIEIYSRYEEETRTTSVEELNQEVLRVHHAYNILVRAILALHWPLLIEEFEALSKALSDAQDVLHGA